MGSPPDSSFTEKLESQAQRDLLDYTKWTKLNAVLYFGLEILLLVLLATTTLVAARDGGPLATATLSAATLFLTGLRQLFLPRERWLSFTLARDELQAAKDRFDRQRLLDLVNALEDLESALVRISDGERSRWFKVRGTQREREDGAGG